MLRVLQRFFAYFRGTINWFHARAIPELKIPAGHNKCAAPSRPFGPARAPHLLTPLWQLVFARCAAALAAGVSH